jgi:hypothetical protein
LSPWCELLCSAMSFLLSWAENSETKN